MQAQAQPHQRETGLRTVGFLCGYGFATTSRRYRPNNTLPAETITDSALPVQRGTGTHHNPRHIELLLKSLDARPRHPLLNFICVEPDELSELPVGDAPLAHESPNESLADAQPFCNLCDVE